MGNVRLVVACCYLGFAGAGMAATEQPCGGPDQACVVQSGDYHVALPGDPQGAPVVLWLHGYASSGASAVRNETFAARFTGRGYALIAPNGQPSWGDDPKLDWSVQDGHEAPRDDVEFLNVVLDDAVDRFGLDGERILAAGFSRGGSMIWDLACKAPQTASAYAAVSGAFWEPMFETCAAPVFLHHTHGFSDGLVPLEGRAGKFQGMVFEQGNIFKGLGIWRDVNGCPGRAEIREVEDIPWRLGWTGCDAGSLTLQLTPGGHGIPEGWADTVLDWFEKTIGSQLRPNN